MAFSSNFPTIRPSLLLDFANMKRLDPRVTFTRASSATFFDQLGVLQTAPANSARFDCNPSTLAAQGLLIEEQRTNSIRNNTMQGAVAGTPGTPPTNWSVSTTGSGLTREIVGTGTENGITYIDIKVSGTASAATAFIIINEGTVGQISASSGQVWTNSLWVKRVAGNTSGFSIAMQEFDSGANFLRGPATPATVTTTFTRITQTVTIGASTASIRSGSFISIANGEAVDITLRIGLPQLELGAFATSVIPTSTTALTRNADVASMTGTNFSSWYSASEGTLYAEFALNGIASVSKVLNFDDGSGFANSIDLYTSSGAPRFDVYFSSSTQAALTPAGGALSINTFVKFDGAYKVNDFAACRNGGTVVTDTSGNIPTVSRACIGNSNLTTQFLNGTIRRLAYYPARLPDAQLVALTG
jgi:hypothetical protein